MIARLAVRTESVKLVYVGRFVPKKQIDLLIRYARRCAEQNVSVDVLIFGKGGEEACAARDLAAGLSNVKFHEHDDYGLARALRVSSAVVIPGYVGLAVTHAFAHGVPVLTRRGQFHSPEVEYIKDAVNGMLLPAEPDQFFAALDNFVADSDLRRRLAAGAVASAATIEMGYMVNSFRNSVRKSFWTFLQRSNGVAESSDV